MRAIALLQRATLFLFTTLALAAGVHADTLQSLDDEALADARLTTHLGGGARLTPDIDEVEDQQRNLPLFDDQAARPAQQPAFDNSLTPQAQQFVDSLRDLVSP